MVTKSFNVLEFYTLNELNDNSFFLFWKTITFYKFPFDFIEGFSHYFFKYLFM